jgi:hypothetical protein
MKRSAKDNEEKDKVPKYRDSVTNQKYKNHSSK